LAACAATLVYVCALGLHRMARARDTTIATYGGNAPMPHAEANVRIPVLLATGIGALTFALSATQWEHAIKYTPYILTACFTVLILSIDQKANGGHHVSECPPPTTYRSNQEITPGTASPDSAAAATARR
jgi:hypothetical protein